MTREDHARVQDLCRQLLQLVSLSQQQRQAIDKLMGDLNALSRRVERRKRAADGGAERGVARAASASPRSR